MDNLGTKSPKVRKKAGERKYEGIPSWQGLIGRDLDAAPSVNYQAAPASEYCPREPGLCTKVPATCRCLLFFCWLSVPA